MKPPVEVANSLVSADVTNLFSTLPVELLSLALCFSLDLTGAPGDDYTACERVLQLRTVCKHWLRVVDTSPALWANICGDDPPSLRAKALVKSRKHPLKIRPHSKRSSPKQATDFLQEICGVMDRWDDIYLQVETFSVPQLHHLGNPAPFAWSVEVASHLSPNAPLPVGNLFGGHAPRLRSLKIFCCTINWDAPIFFALHHLTLDRVEITMPQILQILATSPGLQSLVIKDISSTTNEPDGRYIQVAHGTLQSLHISGLSSDQSKHLLRSATFPQCRSFSYTSPLTVDSSPARWLRRHLFNTFPNVLPSGTSIDVHSTRKRITISSRCAEGNDFRLSIKPPLPKDVWGFIQWMTEKTEAHAMSLSLEGACPLDNATRSILCKLKPVEALRLTNCPDAVSLLSELHVPASSDGQVTWLFPKLSSLTLERCGSADVVLSMLTARQNDLEGYALPYLPPPAAAKVTRLKLVGVRGGKEAVSELRQLMEPGSLEWIGRYDETVQSRTFLRPPYQIVLNEWQSWTS